jgi:hypothetical protein
LSAISELNRRMVIPSFNFILLNVSGTAQACKEQNGTP